MADEESPQASAPQGAHDPPALQDPPQNPNVPVVLNALQAPEALYPSVPHMPPLNWSHFKPEYSSEPDKDAEAHLLRTNDWMGIHGFQDHVKVQRLYLTLTGEARLWYESLRPINAD